VLQCVAVCCSVLQCVTVYSQFSSELTFEMFRECWDSSFLSCSVLQCVAVCCSVLQCVAGCHGV